MSVSLFPTVTELERLETLEATRWALQQRLFHCYWLPAYLGEQYPSYARMQPGLLETLFPEILMWGPAYDHARRSMKLLRRKLKHDFTQELFTQVQHLSDTMGKAWSAFYLQPEHDLNELHDDLPLCYLNLEVRGALPQGGANSDELPGCKKLNMALFQHVHWQLSGTGRDYNRIAYNVALACICDDLFQTEPAFQPVAAALTDLRTKFLGEPA